MSEARQPEEGTDAPRLWLDVTLVTGVTLLAMAIRAWSLAAESVWYDEYITVAFVSAPTWVEAIRGQLSMDWHMVPLYHTLQYLWANFVWDSDYGVRWLSLLMSAANYPLLYAIATRLYGRWAGLTAILLLALSPFHIFHAQGIRPYALVLPLALASQYALLRATDGEHRGRWWVANVAANLALVWTHLFGVFLFPAQGLYLLLFHGRAWRRWVLWGAAHVAIVLPLAVWVMNLQGGEGVPNAQVPGSGALYETVMEHDTLMLGWMDYMVPKEQVEEVLSPMMRRVMALTPENAFRSLRMRGERWIPWVYGLSLAMVLAWTAWRWRALRESKEAVEPLRSMAFVLLWLSLPVLGLFVLARVTGLLVFQPRFMIYAWPAWFVLVGGAVAKQRWDITRAALLAAIVPIFLLQTIVAMRVPARQDYLGAARLYVEREGDGDTPVLVHRMYTSWLFAYNVGSARYERYADWEHHGTTESLPPHWTLTGTEEELWAGVERALANNGTMWVVLLSRPELTGGPPEQEGLAARFMAGLDERGVAYTRDVFIAQQNVWLFRVGEGDGGPLQPERWR